MWMNHYFRLIKDKLPPVFFVLHYDVQPPEDIEVHGQIQHGEDEAAARNDVTVKDMSLNGQLFYEQG